MKKMLFITLFMLATLAWAAAQQAGSPMGQSGGQATPPGSQMPGATQSQPPVPGSAGQDPAPGAMQPGADQTAAPITEGCLGGSAPNFTITDKAGTTYKLNVPPGANTSVLTPHVGESVQVQGNVNGGKTSSIDVQRIGKGNGTCSGSGATGAQSAPKQ